MHRPRTLVTLYILNSTEDKLLMAKMAYHSFWVLPGDKLKYGDKFEVCAKRILLEEASLELEEKRFHFICTFNAVDKENKKHFLSINYFVKLSEEEEKKMNIKAYECWKWFTIEEVLKMEDLVFFGVNKFFEAYKIKKLTDFQNLVSN